MIAVRELATSRHKPLISVRQTLSVPELYKELRASKPNGLEHHETELTNRLFDLTPIANFELTGKNLQRRLAKDYVPSHIFLNDELDAFNRLFEAIVDSQIERRGAHGSLKWAEAVAKSREALLKRISYKLEPEPSILTAQAAALQPHDLFMRMRADIRSRAKRLSAHVFSTLAQASQRAIVGHINWTSKDTCQYLYHTAPILCEGTVKEHSRAGRMVRTTERTTFEHRYGVHVHDLIDARLLHGTPPTVLMPPRVQRLVWAIPQSIRPLLAVVDGLLVNEQIVEWDAFKSETFQQRIKVHVDPAIVLGPYVLVGWSDRDFGTVPPGDKLLRFAARSWMKLTY